MLMRALRFLNLAILSVLVGSAAFVYAQDEKRQEEKPVWQEEAKPQPKQDEAKPSKQEKQVEKQEQKYDREQSRDQAMPEKQAHPGMRGEHARPAGKGGHIPDEKFRAQFGRGHHFNAKTV